MQAERVSMKGRNFTIVLIANVVMGSAMPMLVLLGALAGAVLAPVPLLATAPPSIQMIAGIAAALVQSRYMARRGRQAGFLLAGGLAVVGGLLGALALVRGSFSLLMFAHALMGGALVGVGFLRFVAAEVVTEEWRAHAMSVTLASGLFAALAGPALFSATRDALAPVPFAGAYLAIAGLGAAGMVVVAGLRGLEPVQAVAAPGRGETLAILRRAPVATAILAAAGSTALMVLMMVPTPLAMIDCGFGERQAADVIRWHVVAMFAPGFFTGSLLKRFGNVTVVRAGFAFFALAALVAALDVRIGHFYVGLILLGLAWNFGFTGATAMLQEAANPAERGRAQGINDMMVAAASSLASLASGAVYAGLGWMAISLAIVPVALLGVLALRGRVVTA